MPTPRFDSPPPSLSGSVIGGPQAALAPELPMPFRELLYRYWFFGWLFRDVNRPSLFERAAAWRHNQEQTRWLPTYLRRWAVYSALCLALAIIVEHGLRAQAFSAVFYLQAIIGLAINTVTSVLMLGLKLLPAPF